MERRLSSIKLKSLKSLKILKSLKSSKLFLSSFFLIFLTFALSPSFYAQTPSVIRNIRIPLWAELDAYPELEDAQNLDAGQYDYPIKSIRQVAPFIISGMVYGWNFTYTPSDKARGVEEYLEITEIVSSDYLKGGITYTSPWIENNRFNCWCEYKRNDVQVQNYNLWASIQNPVIQGRGYGDLKKGFEGLRDAAYDALKSAIRNHYRNTIKNKPKEITGSVLIRDLPTIGIDSGRYVFNLDFFLEYGKIIGYSVY